MTQQPNKCIREWSNNYPKLEISCPFALLAIKWSERIITECRWSLLLINTDIELSPAPHNCPSSWWMWLFWSKTDPSQLIPVSLLRTGSSIVPRDMDLKLSMIYAVIRCDFDHSQSRSGSTPSTAILGLREYSQKYYTRLVGVLPKSTPSLWF